MHERSTMIRLLRTASEAARGHGGELRRMCIRAGALAGDPDHLRADFEHVREELGMGPIALDVELEPDRPVGVELLFIEVGVR